MNYNSRTGFSEQDYHLLKTHQKASGGASEIITLGGLERKLSFDNQHNYNFDINCCCFVAGDFSFTGSAGCTVNRIGTANPTYVDGVSRMTITIATDFDNGTTGQIEWGGVRWNIVCASGSNWSITLPPDYGYVVEKTVMGKPWNSE